MSAFTAKAPFRGAAFGTATIAFMVIASSCTASSGGGNTPSTSTSVAEHSSSTVPASHGRYTYERSGVTAILTYSPDGTGLTITNHTGGDIAAPSVYLLRADNGARVDAKAIDASHIPDGSSQRFALTFTSRVPSNDVGLIALILGHDNVGAFQPPT